MDVRARTLAGMTGVALGCGGPQPPPDEAWVGRWVGAEDVLYLGPGGGYVHKRRREAPGPVPEGDQLVHYEACAGRVVTWSPRPFGRAPCGPITFALVDETGTPPTIVLDDRRLVRHPLVPDRQLGTSDTRTVLHLRGGGLPHDGIADARAAVVAAQRRHEEAKALRDAVATGLAAGADAHPTDAWWYTPVTFEFRTARWTPACPPIAGVSCLVDEAWVGWWVGPGRALGVSPEGSAVFIALTLDVDPDDRRETGRRIQDLDRPLVTTGPQRDGERVHARVDGVPLTRLDIPPPAEHTGRQVLHVEAHASQWWFASDAWTDGTALWDGWVAETHADLRTARTALADALDAHALARPRRLDPPDDRAMR